MAAACSSFRVDSISVRPSPEAAEHAARLDADLAAVKEQQAAIAKGGQARLEELRDRLAADVAALAAARAEAAAGLEGEVPR